MKQKKEHTVSMQLDIRECTYHSALSALLCSTILYIWGGLPKDGHVKHSRSDTYSVTCLSANLNIITPIILHIPMPLISCKFSDNK